MGEEASTGRHLAPAQRVKIEAQLRERGWSYQRIAEKVGVSKSQVRRDLSGLLDTGPEKTAGKDGKAYPARRKKTFESQALRQSEEEPDSDVHQVPDSDGLDEHVDLESAVRPESGEATGIAMREVAEATSDPGTTKEHWQSRDADFLASYGSLGTEDDGSPLPGIIIVLMVIILAIGIVWLTFAR